MPLEAGEKRQSDRLLEANFYGVGQISFIRDGMPDLLFLNLNRRTMPGRWGNYDHFCRFPPKKPLRRSASAR
jgi:hypothetical protein